MNSTLTSTLILKLVDGITGPSGRAAAALKALRRSADGVNVSGNRLEVAAGHLRAAAAQHMKTLDMLRSKFAASAVATAAYAAAIMVPVKAAKEFETVLMDIAQKADMSRERAAALGSTLTKLATEVRRSAQDLAVGVDALVGMGLSPDDAAALIGPIGKAATAYRAEIEDLSRAGYAALENLKIPASEFGRVLDVMAQAGKDGAFELRDMAGYLPSIAAAYQGLGQNGVPALADLAAALEVVRKGTGDSASAATNLENVLQKIASPLTAKKFAKFGIDIRKELKKSIEKGESPLDMLVRLTNKALKGDLSKLGDLFEDAQVQKGIRALIQNYGEFLKIRERASKAKGVVNDDFERRLTTTQAKFDKLSAAAKTLAITIGNNLAPAVGAMAEKLADAAVALNDLATAHPQLVSGVILAVGALLTLRTAILGVRLAAIALSVVSLKGLADIAALGSASTSAGLLRTAGAIGAIAAALMLVDTYSPKMKEWLESVRPKRADGKQNAPLPDDGMPKVIGGDVAAKAGQVTREWLRKIFINPNAWDQRRQEHSGGQARHVYDTDTEKAGRHFSRFDKMSERPSRAPNGDIDRHADRFDKMSGSFAGEADRTRAEAERLQRDIEAIVGKPVDFTIKADTSQLDAAFAKIEALKRALSSLSAPNITAPSRSLSADTGNPRGP